MNNSRTGRRNHSTQSNNSTNSRDTPRLVKEAKYLRKSSCNSSEAGDYLDSPTSSRRKADLSEHNELSKQIKTNSECGSVHSSKSDVSGREFFQNFLRYADVVRGNGQVKFEYMRDLYNLDLETFPTDEEIYQIQESILQSTQVNSQKLKKNWSDEEKHVLIWIVGKFCAWKSLDFKNIDDKDWNYMANLMNRRDGFSCKQKWLSMLKLPLYQIPWSPKEDDALREIIEYFQAQKKANKWSSIADELNRKMQQNIHRTGKQCRERWNNHLNPMLNRDPWGDEEDLNLLQLVLQGGKKWAQISKMLNCPRNENSVKNRFNCLMKKESVGVKSQSEFSQEGDVSDLLCADDLNQEEIRIITATIQKLKWRISQRNEQNQQQKLSTQSSNHHEDPKLEEEDKVEIRDKKPSLEKMFDEPIRPGMVGQLAQKLQGLNLENHVRPPAPEQVHQIYTFQLQSESIQQASAEDLQNCQPCLVNPRKGVIYFLSPHEMTDYLNCSNMQTNSQVHQEEEHYPSHIIQNGMFKTLNTIEEVSQSASMPSISQFLNFDQQCERYQLPNLSQYKESLKYIQMSDQKISSSQNISSARLVQLASDHNIHSHAHMQNMHAPPSQYSQFQQQGYQMGNFYNAYWQQRRPQPTPEFQYQQQYNLSQGFPYTGLLPSKTDPVIQYMKQPTGSNQIIKYNKGDSLPQLNNNHLE